MMLPLTGSRARSTTAIVAGERLPAPVMLSPLDADGEGRRRMLDQQLVEIERPVDIVLGRRRKIRTPPTRPSSARAAPCGSRRRGRRRRRPFFFVPPRACGRIPRAATGNRTTPGPRSRSSPRPCPPPAVILFLRSYPLSLNIVTIFKTSSSMSRKIHGLAGLRAVAAGIALAPAVRRSRLLRPLTRKRGNGGGARFRGAVASSRPGRFWLDRTRQRTLPDGNRILAHHRARIDYRMARASSPSIAEYVQAAQDAMDDETRQKLACARAGLDPLLPAATMCPKLNPRDGLFYWPRDRSRCWCPSSSRPQGGRRRPRRLRGSGSFLCVPSRALCARPPNMPRRILS